MLIVAKISKKNPFITDPPCWPNVYPTLLHSVGLTCWSNVRLLHRVELTYWTNIVASASYPDVSL